MTSLDWTIVGLYFTLVTFIAVYYYRRASTSTSEFFLGSRKMPWWLAGTSMVATTFAADTPLAVTELVAENGIAGNWLWWNFAFGGMLTVFFFARLWRRSGIQTDVELVELRYSGRPAAWLRGIKAVYFGLLLNIVIIGWVSLAMETVIRVLLPNLTVFGQTSFSVAGVTISSSLVVVSALVVLVSVYALLSGLWGVAVTDTVQFVLAMGSCIIMAVFVLREPAVGGIAGLKTQLPPETFRFFPTLGSVATTGSIFALTIPAFVAFVGIQWWSSWYPGAEPGGGGYIAQRIMSTRNERDSLFSALFYTIAHYCVRPWPWIIVALSALVLYPNLDDTREGFVLVMRDILPAGLLGLLAAAFLAAFMSTVSTQLNWGVSYLINDCWRRFVQPKHSERYYVKLSRLLTVVMGVASILVATQLNSISEAWELILTASAGLGLVLILRWYWWRINAWSELVATLVPILMVVLAVAGVSVPGLDAAFPNNLFLVVGITTVCWLTTTFLTHQTSEDVLAAFYQRVRPGGPGWGPIAAAHPEVQPDMHMGVMVRRWVAGVVLVYAALFGSGYLIFGRIIPGVAFMVVVLLMAAYLWHVFGRDQRQWDN